MEFQDQIEEAKRLEKKLVGYEPYSGEVTIERTLDLEPKEYVDLSYQDLINLYERSYKIIKTASMGILASEEEEIHAGKESGEVETKLREMTDETLKKAEEVAKEEIVLEREVEKPEPVQTEKIEFESKQIIPPPKQPEKQPDIEIEIERERKVVEPTLEEKKVEKSIILPAQPPKIIVTAIPPALQEPNKAGVKKYDQMEEQVRVAVGEMADENTIKKKMLELTKQLFKEKTTSKREEIKMQITVLKNMLAGTGGKPGKKAQQDQTYAKLFQTMLGTQQSELAQTKDEVIDSYNSQINTIKKKFYEDISATEDTGKRKHIFESFVFSITSLVEQLPQVLEKYRNFLVSKHSAEMEKILDSLEDDKEVKIKVKDRIEQINSGYNEEFATVKGIIGREIENLIEVAGTDIFAKSEDAQPKSEAKAHEIIKEINETDEGTLLYYLHGKDMEYYKRYERKHISKGEALFKAKELMATEKGLSDSMVKKYFTQRDD